jgi:hypothetical protein
VVVLLVQLFLQALVDADVLLRRTVEQCVVREEKSGQ